MKALRAKIAQQTLKLLTTYEWESISIDMICTKLKISKKKISRNIKNKNDLKLIIQAREKTNDDQEYTFKIIVNKASLSDKAKAFLHDNYSTSLDNLYSFGLESFTPIK